MHARGKINLFNTYTIDKYINEDGKWVSLCYYGEDKNIKSNLKIPIPKYESEEFDLEGKGVLIWDEGYFGKEKIKEFSRNSLPGVFFEGMSIFNFSKKGFPTLRDKGGIFIGEFQNSVAYEQGILREVHEIDKDRLYQGEYDQLILEPENVNQIYLKEEFSYVGQPKRIFFAHDDDGNFINYIYRGIFWSGIRHGESTKGVYFQDELIFSNKSNKIVSPKSMTKDKVEFLVSISGHYIDSVDPKYCKDKEIIMAAAQADHPYVLHNCSNKFRNDIDIIKAATDFYYECEDIRDDYRSECAELIGKKLMHDRDFIKESIEYNHSFIYMNKHAKWVFKDKELMLLEIRNGLGWCIHENMKDSCTIDKFLLKDLDIIQAIDKKSK